MSMDFQDKSRHSGQVLLDPLISSFQTALLHERKASPHTVKNYVHDLAEFQDYLKRFQPEVYDENKIDIQRISPLTLRSFIAVLFQKNSPASIARKLSSLRSFLSTSNATFLCSKPFSSARKSSDRMEISGFLMPAASKTSITCSDTSA